ncbi:M56 family metallopeptidase, partial [Singulisphaera rosea]
MQPLLPQINDAAANWFPYVWHVTWQASLLTVLLLVVVRLGRRWPSPLRYALLVIALVKFTLPPQLSMPTGLFSRIGPTVRDVSAETNVSTVVLSPPRLMAPPTPLAGIPLGLPRIDPASKRATRSSAPQPDSTTLDGKSWLMLLHTIGLLASGLWLLHGLLTMGRTIRRAAEVSDGEIRQRFIQLSERLGLRHPPRLLLSHESFGPAAFGVLRPVVIIPSVVAQLEPSALDAVLAHELAHHRRRDPWINWVQLGLSVTWWFNPVVWFLNRQIRRIREDCCDDLLLTHNLTTGPAYCDTLLEAASRLSGRASASVSMMLGAHFHPLGRRLERIMDRTLRRAPRLSLAGMLSLAVLACVALPGLRRSEGDEPTPLARSVEPSAPKTTANDAVATQSWPEGTKIQGRVLDHRGVPIADAEVLLLGEERIIVDADRRNWFVINREAPSPSSTRTDRDGSFTVTRKQGPANRLAVIAKDPLLWVVPRSGLQQVDKVEVKLPPSSRLAIRSDFPNKPRKLPVMIELKSWDGSAWNADSLRFHMSFFSLNNPGETVFEHLPPGHYTVQRFEETKSSGNSVLMSGADRRLIQIEPAKRALLSLERKLGRPLSGQVRGLEGVELREAYLTISQVGPEEVLDTDGRRGRMIVTYDVVPVTPQGRFTIDPIPGGEYSADLFAVRASTPRLSSQSSDFSAGSSFTVPERGDAPKVEFVAKATAQPDLSKTTDLRLRVVDEAGTPVSRLDAMVHTADAGYGPWVSGRDGMVFLGGGGEYREA